MMLCFLSLITFCCVFALPKVLALGQNETISSNASTGAILLANKTSAVRIVLDAADWPGVLRVGDDLAADFGRVTGLNGTVSLANAGSPEGNASMIFNVTNQQGWEVEESNATGGIIIAGTLGKSKLIDAMVAQGMIEVSSVDGKWEAFTSQVVRNPISGVTEALVIVGSDKRGTSYGLYDISEQIGVSPWYYWADVPSKTQSTIFAMETRKVQGPPSVKYRGLFINDEAPALTGYINAKYPPSPWGAGFNADFYATVFELLLRLRANYLWPAMWDSMFNVDDARSQPLADEYGIVMGTSHTEPFMRSTKEWTEFGEGTWQWSTNNESIYPFFVEGAERAKPYEGIMTMGMRGYGDTALSGTIETAELEDIVDTQRQILKNVYGSETGVPQMWCLYNEVQGYYEAGMRVADDITLLWSDDYFGNIRRLPVGNETARSGGAGVYYHFDFVGDPRDYKWINTVQLQKTWEQMHLAYERDAKDIWIVNVGDLKPLEIPINHFFDIAYDFDAWDVTSTPHWLELWATREFCPSNAKEIAGILNTYSLLAARRKYELVDPSTYSLINYEEADRVLGEWKSLARQTQAIHDSLPLSYQPAFFEMVLHPVLGGMTVYDIHISSAKNQLYASQGRNSANTLAQRVLDLFKYDHELSTRYNKLLGGKWEHMMDQTHLGYEYWQQPMRQATPPLQYVQILDRDLAGDMGVSVDGSNATVPGDDQWHTLSSEVLTLPPMDPFGKRRWIDIYSIGTQTFDWDVTAEPFVKLSKTSGTLAPAGNYTDERVYIEIDWSSCPTRLNSTSINITSSTDYGTQYSMPQVAIPLNHTTIPTNFTAGFVESDAHISIEAEHWTSITSPTNKSTPASYAVIPSYGRTLSGVTLFPANLPSLSTTSAPGLEYAFYTFTPYNASQPATISLILGGGLNTDPDRPLRYAVAVDDDEPQDVAYIEDQTGGALPVGWSTAVSDAVWISTTNATVLPGAHMLRLWALEPGVVVQKIVIDLGGVRESYLGPPESYRVGAA